MACGRTDAPTFTPAPTSAPAPTRFTEEPTLPPGATRPPLEDLSPGSFPLNEPIPTSIEIFAGGRTFVVPQGATVLDVLNEAPPVDAVSGLPAASPGEHLRYSLIERGSTGIKVDNETGEVFEAYIAPEDEDDFRDFLDD